MSGNGHLLAMPGFVDGTLATKLVTIFPGNYAADEAAEVPGVVRPVAPGRKALVRLAARIVSAPCS